MAFAPAPATPRVEVLMRLLVWAEAVTDRTAQTDRMRERMGVIDLGV
jgi:hypothetical protein